MTGRQGSGKNAGVRRSGIEGRGDVEEAETR